MLVWWSEPTHVVGASKLFKLKTFTYIRVMFGSQLENILTIRKYISNFQMITFNLIEIVYSSSVLIYIKFTYILNMIEDEH